MPQKIEFFLPPKGILEPNNSDDSFYHHYRPLVGVFFRERARRAFSLLTPPYESILELGYGSGIILSNLAALGKKISGIDLNSDPERVELNLKKIGVAAHLIRGDIRNPINYSDESFDLVVALSIIEHIKENDLKPVIDRVFRLLKPGGDFLIGMPQVSCFMEKMFSLIGYKKIKEHHFTSHRKFLEKAINRFKFIKFANFPSHLPDFATLYFNMLLRKPNRN